MKPKTYSIKEVLNSTLVGFTFEFFCSKESQFIIEDFKQILGKNIVITDEQKIQPTYTSAILLKEYDGVRPRYQFKVDYQPFNEISTFLNTMLFWINENATLNNSTILKTKLQYNFNELKTINSISNMDVGKLVLKIDENFVYNRFPEMTESPYAMSVKKLIPLNMSVNASNVVHLKNSFKMPVAEYYGIDFTEQTRGELTFNYIGGKYSDKPNEVNELLEYYIITTYQSLNEIDYLPSEIHELNQLTEEYRTFRKCYYNAKRFFETYKDFTVYIDLSKSPSLLETQWVQIRDVIGKLILENNIKKCKFNWDTEMGVFQIKNAHIEKSIIKGFQIVDSDITGIVEGCHLWKCNIDNSRLKSTTLVNNNKLSDSFLENVRADRNNIISDSYIKNSGEILNCKINESIIINAGIGDKAKLDENCLVVQPKEEFSVPSVNGIDIKETRDYKWIKTFRRNDYKDEGFANEYKD